MNHQSRRDADRASEPTRVLVLQGGGALGSYQAGIFQALHEHALDPDWVVGISIGAINAALIAGNPPERRLERLTAFWTEITSTYSTRLRPPDSVRALFNELSAGLTAAAGAPRFFTPRRLSPWFPLTTAPEAISLYDTAPLRATLQRLVDFDYLNSGRTRITVGAVDIMAGNSAIFDSAERRIEVDHIMASGALPPGLPPVEIDGRWYWDGGVVSNTPLQFVLNAPGDRDLFVFQVDLFNAKGPMPRSMMEIREREKDIRYSSRTRLNTDASLAAHKTKVALMTVLDALPEAFGLEEEVAFLRASTRENAVTIVQLIYRKQPYEGGSKDYEFSRPTMLEHWAAGLADGVRFVDGYGELLARPRSPGVMVVDPGVADPQGDHR